MRITNNLATRILCRTLALVLANAAIPFGIPKMIADAWPNPKPRPVKKAVQPSKPLSAKQMKTMQGKSGQNPYLAGQNKWDPVFKGVDLVSGNFSTSATDLDFEGGYGIPVNVTRSYSANDPNEGPFGYGWTLSADVRSTAGGLLKGPGAPVRSIPGSFKEQPPMEFDPNSTGGNGTAKENSTSSGTTIVPTVPVQAVVATDAGGTAETIQKDVDGILTTPPWDNNVHNATYEFVTFGTGGAVYQIMTGNTTTTIDGTTYVYAKEGDYGTGGTTPYNSAQMASAPAAVPSNVLKVTSATDRNGLVTTYNYTGTAVTFVKTDGTTTETPLASVSMPNGHVINFVWGDGSTAPTNRIYQVNDNVSGGRTVQYAYSGANHDLASVTTPGGKVTSYGYSYSGMWEPSGWDDAGFPDPGEVLTSITDPRGLTTTVNYEMGFSVVMPYGVSVPGVIAYRVTDPNGVRTYIQNNQNNFPDSDNPVDPGTAADFFAADMGLPGSQIIQIKDWGTYSTIPSGSVAGLGILINIGAVILSSSGTGSSTALTVSAFDGQSAGVVAYSGYTHLRYKKIYNVPNETLSSDDEETPNTAAGDVNYSTGITLHGLQAPVWAFQDVTTAKTYNFMGNPLTAVTTESETGPSGGSASVSRTAETDYAYWDSTKYYQQKATKDQAGRYSFTDYYDSSAATGSKGQTYQVFDNAHAGWWTDTSVPIPTYIGYTVPTSDYWRYQLKPTSGHYSALFDYDSNGRATDVYKLQNTSGTWAYVQTHTTYGSTTDGSWGEAATVTEDYGGIGRTTTTNGYTADGKADDVTDAAGHRFVTTYDGDGVVQSVAKVVGGTSTNVVTYGYGTGVRTYSGGVWSGVPTNGMPTTITDNLSGVVQTLTYDDGSTYIGGLGQVATVTEANGTDSYESFYQYDGAGNRANVKYVTPSATNYWRYDDYIRVGTADNPKFAFQTLTKSDSSWDTGAEAMHYLFDGQGRLETAAFAQTPSATSVVSDNGTWYDYNPSSSYPALTRAVAEYTYDPAGRVTELDHKWQTYNTSTHVYDETYIVGNGCGYEIGTGDNRGLKTGNTFYTNSSGTKATAWSETFGYDANFDYLTSAYYGDSQPNATQSWTYDAAGNRTSDYTGSSWAYDNLNRMTSNGAGTSLSNDILGNRTALGTGGTAGTYTWDCLNRMTATVGAGSSPPHNSYVYRADGMRVEKILHSGLYPTPAGEIDDVYARYRYDGQMPMETFVTKADSSTVLMENGIGARGIDYGTVTTSSGTTVHFPIYDAHGNEVATLSRSGSSYSLTNQRGYGAWGEVRQGATTGGPRDRYCGNLGHVQDDETSLVYMRARYYEAGSGRFISEDRSRNGSNWFGYCSNDPENRRDATGGDGLLLTALEWLTFLVTGGAHLAEMLGISKKFEAFMKTMEGAMDAILLTTKLIQAAALADRDNGSPLLAAAAVQGVIILKTFAVLYAVANLRWWILLNSDPDSDFPGLFS